MKRTIIGMLIGCIATIGIIHATGNTIVNKDKYEWTKSALELNNDLVWLYSDYQEVVDSVMAELDRKYNIYDELPGYYYDAEEAVMQQWYKEE